MPKKQTNGKDRREVIRQNNMIVRYQQSVKEPGPLKSITEEKNNEVIKINQIELYDNQAYMNISGEKGQNALLVHCK